MIFIAVFIILFNLSFLEDITLISGVSVEGIKFLLVFYLAILHFTMSPGVGHDRHVFRNLTVLQAYLTLATISLFFSMALNTTLRSLIPWISIYTVLLVIGRQREFYKKQLEKIFLLVITIGISMSIFNVFFGLVSDQAFIMDDSGISRLAFVKTLPYWYSHLIAMTGFIFYYKSRQCSNKIYLFMSVLIGIFLALSGIRTYIIAYILSIFIVSTFMINKSRLNVVILSMVFCSLLGLLIFKYEPFRTKMFLQNPSSLSDMISNIRLSDRDKIAAYLVTKSYEYSGLITGTGAGTARYILEKDKVFDNTVVSHSDYVRVITEFGIAGLLFYAVLMLFWLKQAAYVMARTTLTTKPYACAYASSVCFIAVGGLAYDLYTPVNVFFAYVLWLLSTPAPEATPSGSMLSFTCGSIGR